MKKDSTVYDNSWPRVADTASGPGHGGGKNVIII
jgi:hypothetical protein